MARVFDSFFSSSSSRHHHQPLAHERESESDSSDDSDDVRQQPSTKNPASTTPSTSLPPPPEAPIRPPFLPPTTSTTSPYPSPVRTLPFNSSSPSPTFLPPRYPPYSPVVVNGIPRMPQTPSPLTQSSEGDENDGGISKSAPQLKSITKPSSSSSSSSTSTTSTLGTATPVSSKKNDKSKSKKTRKGPKENEQEEGDTSQVLGLNGVVNLLTGDAAADNSIFNWLENDEDLDDDDDDDGDDDDGDGDDDGDLERGGHHDVLNIVDEDDSDGDAQQVLDPEAPIQIRFRKAGEKTDALSAVPTRPLTKFCKDISEKEWADVLKTITKGTHGRTRKITIITGAPIFLLWATLVVMYLDSSPFYNPLYYVFLTIGLVLLLFGMRLYMAYEYHKLAWRVEDQNRKKMFQDHRIRWEMSPKYTFSSYSAWVRKCGEVKNEKPLKWYRRNTDFSYF